MKTEEYIKKWLAGTLTEEELRLFSQSREYEFLNRLDRSLAGFRAPEFDIESGKRQLQSLPHKTKVRRLSTAAITMRIAASVLVVLAAAVSFYLLDRNAEVSIVANQKTDIFLPDSSQVSINAQTKLAYDLRSWDERRVVKLEGEAFFQVREGSAFDVVTPAATVTVLGTSFNVKSRDGYFEAACFEGVVRVTHKNDEFILTKGKSLRVLNETSEQLQAEKVATPDWMQGESRFQSIPFIHVIREFERQYNLKVETNNIDTQRLYTGSFTHDNVTLALKTITLPLNLSYSYEAEDGRVSLSSDQ